MKPELLFILLPAFVNGKITININASETDPNVETEGSSVKILSDEERTIFEIQDSKLKSAIGIYYGKEPTDVFVRDPTPFEDLYTKFGWVQVRRTLYPKHARIIGMHNERVAVTTKEFVNQTPVKAKYNAGIVQQVKNTVSSTWSISEWSLNGQKSQDHEITYNIFGKFGKIGTSTSFSHTSSWGQDASEINTVTIGSGLEIELEPGQAVETTLTATRHTIDVEAYYAASLHGQVACRFPSTEKGHYYYKGLEIEEVLSTAGRRNGVSTKEVITIVIYSNDQIVVKDKSVDKKRGSKVSDEKLVNDEGASGNNVNNEDASVDDEDDIDNDNDKSSDKRHDKKENERTLENFRKKVYSIVLEYLEKLLNSSRLFKLIYFVFDELLFSFL